MCKKILCTTSSEPSLQQPSEMNDKLKKQGHYDLANGDYKLVEVVEFSMDQRSSNRSVCGNCVYEDRIVASYELSVYSLKSKTWKGSKACLLAMAFDFLHFHQLPCV
ncbi:hypothetical protein ACFX2B_003899 [Malus domestica]